MCAWRNEFFDVGQPYLRRLSIFRMDSLTAPPAAANSAHLPPHQAGLIDARVTAIEDVARDTGITPIWCMVQRLAALKRSWKIYYACQSRPDMAFLDELKKLDPQAVHLHFDDEAEGKFLDLAGAIQAAPQNAHFYCCGPNPMLKAFEAAAASRPRSNIHIEYFTPKDDGTSGHMGGFWVELARSGEEYFIPEGKKILEVLYEAGVDVDYSCELGICGACETRVISGTPEHHDSVLSEEEQATNERVMICCCGCKTERLVLEL